MNPYPEQRPGWRDDEERREFLVHKAVHLFYMPRLVPDIGVVPEGSTGWHIYIWQSHGLCLGVAKQHVHHVPHFRSRWEFSQVSRGPMISPPCSNDAVMDCFVILGEMHFRS